jgi:TM2 domain-containing membrane protein YozV
MSEEYEIKNGVHCRDCGAVISSTAATCPRCGGTQMAAQQRPEKSRTAAILLALFLGGLGFHKFYLGRPGWGVLYLIFCWTFIPSVIALIELIVYISMSDESFRSKYG